MDDLASRSRTGALVRPDDPEHVDAFMFLVAEAELLDANDLAGWLSLLASEVVYTVPVQTTRLREDPASGPARSFHLNEDRASLELRVKRFLESNAVWSANPPPRIRRFVSNVRVRRTERADLQVSSYLLLLRSRHDQDSYDFISAERKDLLGRNAEGDLELRCREITVDQARLGLASLPVPF
jgi:3-phenylpropionate/cinnamic acid dioxygenase small subunit